MDIGLWPDFEFVSVPQELGVRVYANGFFLQLQPVAGGLKNSFHDGLVGQAPGGCKPVMLQQHDVIRVHLDCGLQRQRLHSLNEVRQLLLWFGVPCDGLSERIGQAPVSCALPALEDD